MMSVIESYNNALNSVKTIEDCKNKESVVLKGKAYALLLQALSIDAKSLCIKQERLNEVMK